MGLLGRAHGGLQQVLDGDLVPQSLVEEPLTRRQLAVSQDLDLHRKRKHLNINLDLRWVTDKTPNWLHWQMWGGGGCHRRGDECVFTVQIINM